MIDLVKFFADQMATSSSDVYCVVDGALVDDIGKKIHDYSLRGRAIFHDRASPELKLAGPWMIACGSREDIQTAFTMASDCQSGVAWCAPCTVDEIMRHLRTLNMARLPKEGLVYFRHYDPDVLASVCPLLDANQAARLLGPATSLGFLAGRGKGATVQRPRELPSLSQSGALFFYEWQVEKLTERQRDLSRQKICKFLRHVLPREAGGRSDDELLADVIRHEAGANNLGLDTERSITQWTHLSLISEGRIIEDTSVHHLVSKDGRSQANENLDANLFEIIRSFDKSRLKTQRAGGGNVDI